MDLKYEMTVLHPMAHKPNEYVSIIKEGNKELDARKREIIALRIANEDLEEQLYPTETLTNKPKEQNETL